MDRSECGVRHKWDHVETERRREAFNAWVRTQANKAGFRLMPPAVQGTVHGMLRAAFYAGSNWQRRHGAIAAAPPPPAEQASGEHLETLRRLRNDADGLIKDYPAPCASLNEEIAARNALDFAIAALSQRPVVSLSGSVNGYLPRQQAIEIKADAPLPEWLTSEPNLRVTVTLAPQQPRHSCGVDAVSDCPACQKDAAEQGYETP